MKCDHSFLQEGEKCSVCDYQKRNLIKDEQIREYIKENKVSMDALSGMKLSLKEEQEFKELSFEIRQILNNPTMNRGIKLHELSKIGHRINLFVETCETKQ